MSRYFSSLVSGAVSQPDRQFLGDLDGVNISERESLSEMRHQHHVWKTESRHAKHVGFEHYRRAFYIDFLPSTLVNFDHERLSLRRRFARDDRDCILSLTDGDFRDFIDTRSRHCEVYSQRFEAWIDGFDIILPRPLFDETIRQQWEWSHLADHWNVLVDTVNETAADHFEENFSDFELMRPSFFNMYVMRLSLFEEYMAFWSDCWRRLVERLPDQPRILGHFSERILNIYVNQKLVEDPSLRVLRLPVVCRE